MPETNVDCLYADAYAFIDQGLCYDEVNDKENARKMYEQGLAISEQAIAKDSAQQSNHLREGLVRVRKLVQERVVSIKQNVDIQPQQIGEMRSQLDMVGNSSATTDAELFYWLPDGVQLVVIENDSTNAPSPPSSLAIFKLHDSSPHQQKSDSAIAMASPKPAAFIQVGPWVYPLIPSQTAILKNELGVYVVPNPTADHPNMFVGIVLPRDIEPRLEDEFVFALRQFAELQASDIVERMSHEQRQRTSERIAQFLMRTGQYVAQNTQNLANATGKYMADKGEQFRANMEPTDQPVNINPAIRHGVFVLHKGSKVVAKVTRMVLDKIGDIGIAVGQKVADSLSGESGGGRVFKSTATVVGGGIAAISTIWMSLEEASKTLMRGFSNETVQTVNLRYGDEASQTAHHALHAVGHTTLAGFQLYELGPRSIAGRMARKAGLQMVQGMGGGSGTSVRVDSEKTKITTIQPKKN